MTATQSYSDNHLFWANYKNSLKKLSGAGILYAVLSLISFPVMYFLTTSRYQFTHNLNLCGTPQIYPYVSVGTYLPLIVLFVLIFSGIVNSYMQNKKAVDAYHSLPIKRETLLFSNYLAVITILVLPMILCYSIVLIGNFSIANITNVTSPSIILEFLRMFCLVCAVTAVSFLCSTATYSTLDSTVFTIILNGIVPAIVVMVELTLTYFVKGYSSHIDALKYSAYTSPIGLMFTSLFEYNAIDNAELFNGFRLASYLWILGAIAVIAIATSIYLKRKSEMAQSYNTSGKLYKFIMIAAAFVVSIAFSCATLAFSSRDIADSPVLLVVFTAIYGFLIYYAANCILSHSFKFTKTHIIPIILSTVLAPIYLILALNGWFGYENYAPKIADTKSVSINYTGKFSEIQHYAKFYNTNIEIDNVYSPNSYRTYGKDMSEFIDEAGIFTVNDIHKSIIADNKEKLDYNTSGHMRNIVIEYTLNNGRKVERHYNLYISDLTKEKLSSLEDNENFVSQQNPILFVSDNKVNAITFTDSFNTQTKTLNLTKDEISSLYKAMGYDLLAQKNDTLLNTKGLILGTIGVEYKNDFTEKCEGEHNGEYKYYSNVAFPILSTATNTIKVLKDLNIYDGLAPKISDDVKVIITANMSYGPYWQNNMGNIIYSTIHSFENSNNANSYEYMIKDLKYSESYFETENPQQINEIASLVTNAVKETEQNLLVVFYNKNATDYDSFLNSEKAYYYLSYDNAPDYIKQKISVDEMSFYK